MKAGSPRAISDRACLNCAADHDEESRVANVPGSAAVAVGAGFSVGGGGGGGGGGGELIVETRLSVCEGSTTKGVLANVTTVLMRNAWSALTTCEVK